MTRLDFSELRMGAYALVGKDKSIDILSAFTVVGTSRKRDDAGKAVRRMIEASKPYPASAYGSTQIYDGAQVYHNAKTLAPDQMRAFVLSVPEDKSTDAVDR
jgi:hypothetical protein